MIIGAFGGYLFGVAAGVITSVVFVIILVFVWYFLAWISHGRNPKFNGKILFGFLFAEPAMYSLLLAIVAALFDQVFQGGLSERSVLEPVGRLPLVRDMVDAGSRWPSSFGAYELSVFLTIELIVCASSSFRFLFRKSGVSQLHSFADLESGRITEKLRGITFWVLFATVSASANGIGLPLEGGICSGGSAECRAVAYLQIMIGNYIFVLSINSVMILMMSCATVIRNTANLINEEKRSQ